MGYNDKYPDMSAMYAVQFEYENKLKDRIKELEKDLERTHKALDVAKDVLKEIDDTRSVVKENLYASYGKSLNSGNVFCWTTPDEIHNVLAKITALEKSELENLEMLVNNVFK